MESRGNRTNEPQFSCPICKQNFYLGSNLRNHVEVAHYVLKDTPVSKVKRRRYPKKFATKAHLLKQTKASSTPAKGINKKKPSALSRSKKEIELENADNSGKQRANCSTFQQTHLDSSIEEIPAQNSMVVNPIGVMNKNTWLIKECRVVLHRLPDSKLASVQFTDNQSVSTEKDDSELPLNQCRSPSPELLESAAPPDSCATSKETEDQPCSSSIVSEDRPFSSPLVSEDRDEFDDSMSDISLF